MNLQVTRRISNTRRAQSVHVGGILTCRSVPTLPSETGTQDGAKTEGKIKGPARAGPQVLVCTLVITARGVPACVPFCSANPVVTWDARVPGPIEYAVVRWRMAYELT